MTQPPRNPPHAPSDLLERVGDRSQVHRPDHVDTAPQMQKVGTYAVDDVVVLEVAGRLSDVVKDLDRAIQLALADGPRGVACDLSDVLEDAEPDAVQQLASTGRHVRDWPGIPVALACPYPQIRTALKAHPLGGYLIVSKSVLTAVAEVLATPAPAVESLRLAPHPTAARAARDFVTRALLKWRLGAIIPSVCLVASELVTNSVLHAATDIDVTVAWNLTTVRLTVGDRSSELPSPQRYQFDRHGHGLTIVAGLSRAFGVLPAEPAGKVVWAVFDVPRQHAPTKPHRSGPATATP